MGRKHKFDTTLAEQVRDEAAAKGPWGDELTKAQADFAKIDDDMTTPLKSPLQRIWLRTGVALIFDGTTYDMCVRMGQGHVEQILLDEANQIVRVAYRGKTYGIPYSSVSHWEYA